MSSSGLFFQGNVVVRKDYQNVGMDASPGEVAAESERK